jgi:hypothetical protein
MSPTYQDEFEMVSRMLRRLIGKDAGDRPRGDGGTGR